MGRLGTALAAAAVAAVLGTAGGVLSAVSSERDPAPPTSSEHPSLTHDQDPLRLGVEQVDLTECDGRTVLLLAWGESQPALQPSVLEHPDARYLDTTKSCDTAYPRVNGRVPRFMTYLPPFDTPTEACQVRMGEVLKGSFTTILTAGNTTTVICGCYIKADDLLVIGQDVKQTAASGMYVKLYQRMLMDAGLLPPGSDTGVFGDDTRAATFALQSDHGLNPTGNVNAQTWRLVQNQACPLYDYGI